MRQSYILPVCIALFTLSLAACAPGPAAGATTTRPADDAVMVYVPGGAFEMGSGDGLSDEQPLHTVELDGFWIDRTEVTNAQYARCVAVGGCEEMQDLRSKTRLSYHGDPAYDDYPVLCVDWDQAAAYCAWAGGRLPTEAEWEYAARGPDGYRYPWGDAFDGSLLNHAGYSEDGVFFGRGGIVPDSAPVGHFPDGASWCGALDLAGNVWEWAADWYGGYSAEGQENPTGPVSGDLRVARGGSWSDGEMHTRSTARFALAPGFIDDYLGFRCVLTASTAER